MILTRELGVLVTSALAYVTDFSSNYFLFLFFISICNCVKLGRQPTGEINITLGDRICILYARFGHHGSNVNIKKKKIKKAVNYIKRSSFVRRRLQNSP